MYLVSIFLSCLKIDGNQWQRCKYRVVGLMRIGSVHHTCRNGSEGRLTWLLLVNIWGMTRDICVTSAADKLKDRTRSQDRLIS